MINQASLHAAFIPFGEIVDVSLPAPEAPSSTELHRGFGYVQFEDSEDAKEAIDNMDQSELFGRVIKVSAAKPQKNFGEGLGSKTALWEQVRLFLTAKLFTLTLPQEGWLAENAVSEEDKVATEDAKAGGVAYDPMQGLEGLDVAGPKPA